MKVLYIDGDGPLGGASRSLFEVVRPLSEGPVEPYFVAVRGTALNFYRQIAKDIIETRGLTKFDNTRYSYYRGARWFILLREIFHLPFTILALLKARYKWGRVDLIHVNEFVCIVPGLIAKRIFDAPMVVHVRSLARVDKNSVRTRWLNETMRKNAAAIVAIDENTRLTLPQSIDVDVIQNSFTPKTLPQSDAAMQQLLDKLRPGSLKVGFVGNLHVSKGIFDLLDAAKLVREAGRDVEFVIIGGVTVSDKGLVAWALAKAGIAQNVQADLTRRVGETGLADIFHLFGPTMDIQRVYERLDVVAFPSHFDSPGRPVFEAAFSAVPAVVAVANPQPDTLVDGETGIAVPVRDVRKLADAIIYFADHRDEVRRMGYNARKLAEANSNPANNARKILAVYQRVLEKSNKQYHRHDRDQI